MDRYEGVEGRLRFALEHAIASLQVAIKTDTTKTSEETWTPREAAGDTLDLLAPGMDPLSPVHEIVTFIEKDPAEGVSNG